MPITLFHGLALMFLYFKNKRRIDLLALMVSSTFIDFEVPYYFLLGEPLDHRLWHGFAASLSIYPILVTFGAFMVERWFEPKLWSVYNYMKLKPNQVRYSLLTMYLCSLVGGISHVFFDMFTHVNMPYVLYPLMYGNPFYLGQISIIVEIDIILLTIYSCVLWLRERTPS